MGRNAARSSDLPRSKKRREPPEAIPFPTTQQCNTRARNGVSGFQGVTESKVGERGRRLPKMEKELPRMENSFPSGRTLPLGKWLRTARGVTKKLEIREKIIGIALSP
jgi:hypothetical protein